MVKKDIKGVKKQIANKVLKKVRKNQEKINDISGTWLIEGKILRINHDNLPVSKLLNYKQEIIITHNKEDNDYLLIYSKPDSGTPFSLRPKSGYHPGLITKDIINIDKINVMITDYDDNGVFNLKEFKREKGEITQFVGTYFESGFSSLSLVQAPTVAKLKMTKISKDILIEKKDNDETLEENIISVSNIEDDEFSWNTKDMFQEKLQNISSNRYIIDYSFPLLNNKMECVGIGYTSNTYTASRGINNCSTHTKFSFYDKPEKYLQNGSGPDVKYNKKKDTKIVGYFNTDINFQGLRDNSKFLVGEVITAIEEYEGKLECGVNKTSEGSIPKSFFVLGYADGSRRAKILF